MDSIKYEMEGPKKIYEIGLALEKLLNQTAIALKDGFQPGPDLISIIGGSISEVAVAIGNFQEVPADFKENPVESAMAIANPCMRGLKAIVELKK